jgi:serine/threonine protein kinase
MRDAARGVAYIHLQDGGRAMHRDLKPDNVLVFSTSRGVVGKVTDFGTVKMMQLSTARRGHKGETASARLMIQQQLDRVSASHAVTVGAIGTILYMAPEVLRADPTYTQAIDVFSMGVMLWQVATLAPPNLLAMHGKQRGPPATGQSNLLEEGVRLPLDQLAEQWYRTLVGQCFAHDPAARPLMQRLGEVLNEHLKQT